MSWCLADCIRQFETQSGERVHTVLVPWGVAPRKHAHVRRGEPTPRDVAQPVLDARIQADRAPYFIGWSDSWVLTLRYNSYGRTLVALSRHPGSFSEIEL